MAIKMRRGAYKDFNPDMMVPGEIAVVLSGGPAVLDGRTFYICFEPGKVKRLMTKEDLQNEIDKVTTDIVEQVTIVADKAEDAADRLDAAQDILDALAQSTSTAGTAKEQLDTAITIAEDTLQNLEPIQNQIDTVKVDITAINADIEQMQTDVATNTANIADLETGKADKPIDTGWIEPTLINGFTQPANTVETRVAYRRIGNIVYVRGTAYGGSVNNAIFAVPVNLQPSRAVRFLTTNQSQTYNRIGVAGGNLSVTGTPYGQWVSLDSVHWILD